MENIGLLMAEKMGKMIQAFRIDDDDHAEIKKLAKEKHRKITDQVRDLIQIGLKYVHGEGGKERLTKEEILEIINVELEKRGIAKEGTPKTVPKKKRSPAS